MLAFDHLEKNNLSYFQHWKRAMTLSLIGLIIFVVAGFHSVLPMIFSSSTSNLVQRMNKILQN